MSQISRAVFFKKLNPLTYKAIESATIYCKVNRMPKVELSHWFHQILILQDSDVHNIIRAKNIDSAHLSRDLTNAIELQRGSNQEGLDFSDDVLNSMERAWVYSSLMFSSNTIRSGYLLIGILKNDHLRDSLFKLSIQFKLLNVDELITDFDSILAASPEQVQPAVDGSRLADRKLGDNGGAIAPAIMGKQEALEQFTIDLTEQARSGKLDPIVGRDTEIRQMVDILMRRRQNNPILTGEAGVGKTAVVEGFAQRIIKGDVPPNLKEVSVRTLDLGLLQAGASMKGEFENRLKQIIEEVQSSVKPIILFIDEAHTLIGAGGAAGTGDAANLLKPALARGTLRTIAATTWAEYKKYFEKDPALTRRFQVIQVDEPSEDKAVLMLRSVASVMEKHHKVSVLDEALEEAVKLSHRYIPARQLPDKAVSVLDTASARVAISQHASPAELYDCQQRIQALKIELEIIAREAAVGFDVLKRQSEAASRLAEEQEQLVKLTKRWEDERELVYKIIELRKSLRSSRKVEVISSQLDPATDQSAQADSTNLIEIDREQLLKELSELQEKLTELQGESPLILPIVDGQAVASVIADWTGIPVGRMVRNEIAAVLNLGDRLNERVIGQRHALDMIARRIQTTRAGLDSSDKPIGVFLLAGPSGVGKTETGIALAEALYGGEENIITINMSEFQEAHTVSTLKGSPPGYVGYGEGGVLTEAVRRRPYSVVLLDEIEKAHPDVHEIFFQVFDKGWMEDAEGRYIDFRNTLILLTTNAGTELIMGMCADPELMPSVEGLSTALKAPLLKIFPPALLSRVVTIPYFPLSDSVMHMIIRLKLNKIVRRVAENHQTKLSYTDEVVELLTARCNDVDSGARVIDTILTNTVLPTISQKILQKMLVGESLATVELSVVESDFNYKFINNI